MTSVTINPSATPSPINDPGFKTLPDGRKYVVDDKGRRIILRNEIPLLDEMDVYMAAGEGTENRLFIQTAMLVAGVEAIDDVAVSKIRSNGTLRAAITLVGRSGVAAIMDAVAHEADAAREAAGATPASADTALVDATKN